jgi:hypothetical protein
MYQNCVVNDNIPVKCKQAASRQNQHSSFATSMDPDQPTYPHSLIRIHAVRAPTLLQVEKLIANSMDPVRLHGCTGWSGSMLVVNPLCWFCRDTAQMFFETASDD